MEPVEKRSVGPVTSSAGIGTAVAALIAWLTVTVWGVEMPEEIKVCLAIIIPWTGAIIGGWLVRPGSGSRRA